MKKFLAKTLTSIIFVRKYRKVSRAFLLKNIDIVSKQLNKKQKGQIRSLKGKHNGNTFYIIGGAPSLKTQDLSKIKGDSSIVLTCNRGYHLKSLGLKKSDYHFIADFEFMEDFKDEIDFVFMDNLIIPNVRKNKKIVHKNLYKYHYKDVFINEGKVSSELFYFDLEKAVASSRTIVAIMLQFCVYMGAKEIVLLGVDLSFNLKENHCYESTVGENGRTQKHSIKHKNEMYNWLKYAYALLKEQNIKLYNGSPLRDSLTFMEKVKI